MSQIILYDLPSKGRCSCWSPNPWKTRLALNFKGLDYKTEWLEYPDVAPTLKSLGISPNATGTPYTIPSILLPPSSHVMDSRAIASALESAHPHPSLHLDSPILPRVEAQMLKIFPLIFPVIAPRVPSVLLNPVSAEYFERTRAERFGMKDLAQLEREKGGEVAWKALEEPVREMAAILKENGGPFFLGKEPSYADFYLVGLLQWCVRVGAGVFEKMVSFDDSFKALYDASKPWLEKDD